MTQLKIAEQNEHEANKQWYRTTLDRNACLKKKGKPVEAILFS